MKALLPSLLAVCLACACQRSKAETQQSPAAESAPAQALQPAEAPQPGAAPQPAELLTVGAIVPAVSGESQNGERVALRDLTGKPLVVYFYPKDDTPGCTVEAQEIRDLWQEIRATNAVVIGVSTDDADSHRAFADKHALPFHLLPDPNHEIAKAFGVPLKSGRASRVSFVVGRDGKIAKVFPEVTPRGHGQELLAVLKTL